MDRYFGVERDTDEADSAVVYGRVSRWAQRNGLRSQRQAMEAFCLGAGLAVDAWLTEIGGGPDFKPPVFRALMDRIENRARCLLPVARRDRLGRFGFDGFALHERGMRSHCERRPQCRPQHPGAGVGPAPAGPWDGGFCTAGGARSLSVACGHGPIDLADP